MKPGLAKSAAEQLVDPEKRDALALSLDLKMLFEYLNSSEDSALEIVLAAFHHRIEQDYHSKMSKNSSKSEKSEVEGNEENANIDSNDLLPANSLLQQYLEKSPETNELWSILAICLKRDKTKGVIATMLLSCFASILKFTTWPHLQYLRSTIARTITKSHMQMCSSNLVSEQPMLINATLSLLTEIVHVSPFHARDLFSAFNWSQKPFFNLVNKKNASYEGRTGRDADSKSKTKEGEKLEYQSLYLLDVRTHYIQFGLAFLEHNDASLTQDVLGVPSFLSGVFKEMVYDATALILQTFETLHEHVLLHPSLSKTCKTHFFTSWILNGIASIYKRFTKDEKLGALASLTRRRIQAFLESLLASPTEGIIYLDLAKPFASASRLLPLDEELALGTSGSGPASSSNAPAATADRETASNAAKFTIRNKSILKFIQLLQPQESSWHEKLVLQILDKDTHLAKSYFDALRLSIEPRPTNTWVKNVTWMNRLLDVRPLDLESLVNAASGETSSVSNFSFDRVAGWYAPQCCLQRAHLSAGLRHTNLFVRFATVTLIQRILMVLDDLHAAFNAELALCPVAPESTLLHQLYEGISNSFKRRIPDLDSILTLFNTGLNATPSNAISSSASAASASTNDAITLDVEPDQLTHQVMSLMSAYLRRFPESFVELNFDFGKLLSISEPWTAPLRVQEGLVDMLEAANSKLRWNANLPSAGGKSKTTQLNWILRFLVSCQEPNIHEKLFSVCRHVLLTSGLFDRSPSEINTWLELLKGFPYPSCVTYFESALSYLSLAPHFWAEEMGRVMVAAENPELLTLWKQGSFPVSSAHFPFSILALAIIKDHAHIMVSILGGPTEVDSKMQDPATWNGLCEVAEYLNSVMLQILLSSELPMPIIYSIVNYGTSAPSLPSHDTGRGKNTPLSEVLSQTPAFSQLFMNLRGFVHKVFQIMPVDAAVHGLGVDIGLPIRSPWTPARTSPHISIFEVGDIAALFGTIAADPQMQLSHEMLNQVEWADLGPISFLCHLFTAPLRSLLTNNEQIKMLSLSLMAQSKSLLPSIRALLFFISSFLHDEHSGDCLHFALHLLSTLFTQSLASIDEESKIIAAEKSSESHDASVSSGKKAALNKKKQTSAAILRLILGNPSLNSHFLRDLSHPSSIALSQIIAHLLEAIALQSAHHLVSEVKELATVPLSKLANVFNSLLNPSPSPAIVHCIPLVRTLNCFMSPSVFQNILSSILHVPAKYLLSEDGLPLFDLLVQMLLLSSSSRNIIFKLSVPCFRMSQPPANVAHVARQPLLPECGHVSVFEAPPCTMSNFASLLELHKYIITKTSKLQGETLMLVEQLDQVVFRLLLSSFNATMMPADSSSSITALSVGEAESLSIGDAKYVSQIGAPFLPPDLSLLVTSELVESLLKSMRKFLESDSTASSGAFVPLIFRAGICALYPARTLNDSNFSKLLSNAAKNLEASIGSSVQLKSSAVQEDLKNDSASFAALLQDAHARFSKYWFVLVLLHVYCIQETRDEKLIAKAFKPFANLVVAGTLHHRLSDQAHPVLTPLVHLLVQCGIPVLQHVISQGKVALWKDKELDELQKTFASVAAMKDYSMSLHELNVMTSLLSGQDASKLVNQLALQASVQLQSILKLKENDQSGTTEFALKVEMLQFILDKMRNLIPELWKMDEDDISKIFRRLLRHGYEREEVLDFVFAIVQHNPQSSKCTSLLSTLHDLLVSHTSFVKLLMVSESDSHLSANEFTSKRSKKGSLQRHAIPHSSNLSRKASSTKTSYGGGTEARVSLLRLLCAVYDAEPDDSNKFSSKMLTLYMSAYHATLSPSDQLMLHIVMVFERHEINFSHAGFLWGSVAREYATTSKFASKTTEKAADAMDVDGDEEDEKQSIVPEVELATFQALLLGGQLTPQRFLLNTVRNFSPYLPVTTGAHFQGENELFPVFKPRTRLASLLDPRFLLLIYQFGMTFFENFDCKKFIEVGGLGLVFQTLSSFDPKLRALGYQVLASFSSLLDKAGPGASMREANQVRLLLSVLKAAISTENLLLAGPTVAFLAEISLVLIRVDHPLFLELHNFLLARPALSLTSVPILRRFLISSHSAAKLERDWVLRVIEHGVRAPSDLALIGLRVPSSNASSAAAPAASSATMDMDRPASSATGSAIVGTSLGKNDPHAIAILISHLTSNMASSFAAVAERHRIWAILARCIANDAPAYKNTLTGPGGLAPFLAMWTANHALNVDRFSVLPTATVSSPAVYAEVLIVLRAIIALPEISTSITKSRSLWLQFQPIIYNILHYLQLSYAKFGSLRSGEISSVAGQKTDSGREDTPSNAQPDSGTQASSANSLSDATVSADLALDGFESDLPSHAHNVYWRLLSPCIKLLYHFASNSSLSMGAPTQMLTLAAKLLSHLVGSFRPICSLHKLGLSNTTSQQSLESKYDCSFEQIEIAEHYMMLSHAVLQDKPDEFDQTAVNEWCTLAQLSARVVLQSNPNSSERFHSLHTLLGQLSIVSTTSQSPIILENLAKSLIDRSTSAGALLNAILFAYRQHSPTTSPENIDYQDLIILVLLNTLCTLIAGKAVQSRIWANAHEGWTSIITKTLPSFLKSTRTLAANTLHEPTLVQFYDSMMPDEKKAHTNLASVYRTLLAADVSQAPPTDISSLTQS